MKTRIHVNQHNIRANSKGEKLPVLTVKDYKQNRKCNEVEFQNGRLVYSPDKPWHVVRRFGSKQMSR